jgi:1,2-dihydroxy-3-keto-5-methylthiopentene dioxygenase
VLTHLEDIASTLAEHGVHFDRWQATAKLQPGASHEEIIGAYQAPIDQLMTARGYISVDVISLDSDHPEKTELRARFLREHSYEEDQVRFFVAGRGLFSLHIDDYVYAVLCERNDMILVPAGTRQWIDMGEHPHFTAIRLFNNAQGLEARFTGVDIASQFPVLED